MTEQLSIDNNDAFSTYGLIISDYKSLFSLPALKDPDSIDWWEDGLEVDLSNPVLDTRELEINFYIKSYKKLESLFELLEDGAYHTFDFTLIGLSRKLRFVSQPSLKVNSDIGELTLKFADDFPLYSNETLTTGQISDFGYTIDGINVSDYGLAFLEGSLAEILKSKDIKENLIIKSTYSESITYDSETVKTKYKEVTLKTLIEGTTAAIFWNNYQKLLYDLVQPGTHSLYCPQTEESYIFYYKEGEAQNVHTWDSGFIWVELNLKLVFL